MSSKRGRSTKTSNATVRELNNAVRDRAETVRTTAYAALDAARGRSASAPPGSDNDRAVTRRASSVETRDTTFGRQSSADDAQEDEEDSSAGVGAGSSSADVGADFSSADVGAGRSRPATAISGTSLPNPTAPYPNLNPTVPSTTLTKTELVAQANEFLREINKQAKIRLATKSLRQQVQINFEASDSAALELSEDGLHIALDEMLDFPHETVLTNSHSSSVNVVSTAKPPSLRGVITERDVLTLQNYSSTLGAAHLDLRHILDKAAIITIQTNLEARGHQFGLQARGGLSGTTADSQKLLPSYSVVKT